jgi:hypothetical protein
MDREFNFNIKEESSQFDLMISIILNEKEEIEEKVLNKNIDINDRVFFLN